VTRVALVTCAELPEADRDTRLVIDPLAQHGVHATAVVWDDPAVDWAAFDLAVVRSCWDYAGRRGEFLAWARRVPRLANPSAVLAWNTDKRYLIELAAGDIPVVPTTWVQPAELWRPPEPEPYHGSWVVKPAVSLAGLDAGRYDLSDPEHRRLARRHVNRLQAAGRLVMVQPYVEGIDTDGETSLVFINGRFSHAMRKGPVLDGPDRRIDRRFAPDGGLQLQPRQPTSAQLRVAQRALDAVPGGRDRLLYARVDLVPNGDGDPLVMEIELTEPQLYLARVLGAAELFASAIAAQA
jgi:hypothetical protein